MLDAGCLDIAVSEEVLCCFFVIYFMHTHSKSQYLLCLLGCQELCCIQVQSPCSKGAPNHA